MTYHVPVLAKEVIDLLELKSGDVVVDGTVGDGGHAEAILQRTHNSGQLLGIDLDPTAIATARKRLKKFGSRVKFVRGNFRNIDEHLKTSNNIVQHPPQAILFDLGLRSAELEESGRGFSFRKEEPLLMTFDPDAETTAATIVNGARRDELVRILREYGEERFAQQIAAAIIEYRKHHRILTTTELAFVVAGAVPRNYEHGRIHPATRTFQALRIAVNDELGALREGIEKAFAALSPGGRLAIISFHSLEDRIVKHAFRRIGGRVITKKPVIPTEAEIKANPRSRSAKLRVIEKTI